ncbi:MAG: RNB domain-containing ribonuclease [Desulfobulbaceae bacterium]|nr:RNB domain-containing ribonuclease [Desulfobulbaceae bacterium]MDP2003266.1 ribonuclease catalytic domain-containing protein [Desulfurivibrionaceae bacterium]
MGLQGAIIEYMEQGRFICAMVLDEDSKRLRLINQNGREVNLPLSRLLHQSAKRHSLTLSRDEQLRLLKEADQARHAMLPQIDLAGIWQLASEEEGGSFSPAFLAELSFGEDATDNHVAAFLRSIFVDRLYFKYKEGMVLAHSPEAVAALRLRQEREKEQEALMSTGAMMLKRLWDGDTATEWPERDRCLALLGDYYVFGNEAEESELARDLLKKAGLTGPHDVYHLLVRSGVWQPHENVALLRYAIPVDFSGELSAAAAQAPEPIAEELVGRNRRDLRELPLLTIDGESTRDYDDALHVERRGSDFLVGIHISDVAHYVMPGTPIYAEAARRMTSLYFPETQIPMLPPALSEGVCSLVAGKARAAMSVMVLLSPQGEVLEFDLVPSLVQVKRQLSYPEAERLAAGGDWELQALARLSEQLKQHRIEKGALLLPVPDVNITIDPEGKVSVALSPVDTISRSLVAEFMVLANTLSAQFVADRQAPGLFRAQDEPHQRLIAGGEKDLFSVFRQRKQLKPGELLVYPKPHSGVGVMQYTTVTSPIRRFLDLVMQHQIKNMLLGRGAMFSADELAGVAGDINTVLARVSQVRRMRHRYWLLRYLEQKVGARVEALLVNKGPKRINLTLLDCLLDADMPPSQSLSAKPGDVVSVRVAKVDALDNVLRLEW